MSMPLIVSPSGQVDVADLEDAPNKPFGTCDLAVVVGVVHADGRLGRLNS